MGDIVALLQTTSHWDQLCHAHEMESIFGEVSAIDWVRKLLRKSKPTAVAIEVATHKPSTVSSCILRAAGPWCLQGHAFLPATARRQAVKLFLVLSLWCKRQGL